MRSKQKIVIHIISLLAIGLVSPITNAASSSVSYSITRDVLSSAGNSSSSLNYTVLNVVGQTAVGMSASANLSLNAGFLSTSDTDGDGVFNNTDNCMIDFNPTQLDTDSDGFGNSCDLDDDGDGLSDVLEATLGTNSLLTDTDSDGLSDFSEVNFDGDPNSYQVGVDTNPNNPDTDGDGLLDGSDPLPLTASTPDGDLAPLDAPDGIINAADVLIARRIVLGYITASPLDLAHGDVFPPGNPDGIINIQDLILIQNLVLP